MFGRKKFQEDDKLEFGDELGIPAKPAPRAPAPPAPGAAAPRPPMAAAPRPSAGEPAKPGDAAKPAGEARTGMMPPPAKREPDTRKLIVGREISLSGEITSCDRLVVEGSVEANLANCRDIDIAESGLFKGSASIDDAEVRGRFEGTLTVRRRLLIRATGKVTGTVRYGQVEIECGGQVAGDVQSHPVAEGIDAIRHEPPVRPNVVPLAE